MQCFKLKDFARWAKKIGLTDDQLSDALDEMSRGLLGDRLGGFLFKKRIGVRSRGKRSGARTIVLFKADKLAVFIYGYAKNDKSDLEPREEIALRLFADELLQLTASELERRHESGALVLIKENSG